MARLRIKIRTVNATTKEENGKPFDKAHKLKFAVLNMSCTKDTNKLAKSSIDPVNPVKEIKAEEGEVINNNESCTYSVTVSTKPSSSSERTLAAGQKSFISIHSTDHLCQVNPEKAIDIEECNLEVLSLNEVFPSTSEESLSDDETPIKKKIKNKMDNPTKSSYAPMNSKSSTMPRHKEPVEAQPSVYSDYNIPKNTLYVVGSNPGEPKMSYTDPPKKISKTMKKFLRNIDKHKNDHSKNTGEKAISKLTTMRSILKDGRCVPECTGDSVHGPDEYNPEDLNVSFSMNYHNYNKAQDKSVSFNTQVVIIHFSGDLCVGQSVETLSKEKDQQARNSELRKTFLTKYNEFWPTQK